MRAGRITGRTSVVGQTGHSKATGLTSNRCSHRRSVRVQAVRPRLVQTGPMGGGNARMADQGPSNQTANRIRFP